MKLFYRILTVTALVCIGTAASAQNQKEIEAYQEAAGWDLPIYRGKQIPDYNFRFNGTFYWDNMGYRVGDICFAGKVYKNIQMNIDAARQAVYVRFQNNSQTRELDRTLVEWLTMDNFKFLNLRALGVKKAPEGFFKVLREGPEGFNLMQVTKTYRESVQINGYYRIGYEDPEYNDKVYIFYQYDERFFFLDHNGKLSKFGSMNSLFRKHPNISAK